MIYLDYAATTPVSNEVLDSFVAFNKKYFANPSSAHKVGIEASRFETKAREQIASLFRVAPNEVLFTSGATESNNLAIKGTAFKYQNRGKHIITTQGEHPSVLNAFEQLEKEFGFRVTYLPLLSDGKVDIEALKKAMDEETILVSIMSVNNEVGAINDIATISKIVKSYKKAIFHTDATQAIGKIDIDYSLCDLVSLSAHKINGFKGSGLLIKKANVDLLPLASGGGQEFGLRSGTNNVPYELSLAKALRIAFEKQKEHYEYVAFLNKYLREQMKNVKGVYCNSSEDASPFIINFGVNKKASVVQEALSNKEIYVSTKSACSSKKTPFSHVLKAMGKDEIACQNAIRISLSHLNTKEELTEFVKELTNILDTVK
jgi:cysteine desulfurase